MANISEKIEILSLQLHGSLSCLPFIPCKLAKTFPVLKLQTIIIFPKIFAKLDYVFLEEPTKLRAK